VYGYVRHWVSRVAQLPRAFFEMDRPEIEHAHFTSMFNAIHARQYDNPYVHDLFVLHERRCTRSASRSSTIPTRPGRRGRSG